MSTTIEEFGRWLRVPAENEHLEFKRAERTFDFEVTLEYAVALANERGGKLILGVTDSLPRQVLGTQAFQNVQDARERLFNTLRVRVEVEELQHPDGRVLIFHVPSRPIGMPLERKGRYLMRVGEQLHPMSPDQLQRILAEAQPDYTAELLAIMRSEDLDHEAVTSFRTHWTRRSSNPHLPQLSDDQLLADAGLVVEGRLTVAGLVLLGSEQAMRNHLPQAEVVFEHRSSDAAISYQQRIEFRSGFLSFYDQLWKAINLRNDRQSYQDGLFRLEIATFDETVVREAILNAISHRDYRLGGSVFVRQYPRRLEIVSPGGFPPGITEANVLDRQVPRNRKVAEALQLCGLVERSGQGMNRMFEESIKQGKRVPDFVGTDAFQVRVEIKGEVQQPAFVRYLEKLGRERVESFITQDFLVLDHVHRGEPLPEGLRIRVARLTDVGAIERVGRKLILSRALYADLGQRGVYTRRKGLDHETQKELLLTHLRASARDGSPLAELVQVLPQLGDRKVQALLGELRTEGRVELRGKRRWALWYPLASGSATESKDKSNTDQVI